MNDKLEDWRKQIDALDEELLEIMAKRIDVVSKIGEYKKEKGIPPLDEKRWRQVLESRFLKGEILSLPKKFTKKLLDLIHECSLEVESEGK